MFLFFAISITDKGQTYQKTDTGIKTVINSVGVEIQFYTPSTVRILKWPAGTTFTKKSLSVIETPQKTAFSINQSGDELFLKSKNVQVDLNLKNGRISFSTPTGGEPLLREKEAGVSFAKFNDAGAKTYTVGQSFVLDKGEAIYGLGQQQQGKMNQRNDILHMIQGNTDDYIPYFLSEKGYGLYWDNYSPTLFVDNPDSTTFIRSRQLYRLLFYVWRECPWRDCTNARLNRSGTYAAVMDLRLLAKQGTL
jgi:alpha-D-xyloside xylohydrolase